MLNWIKAQWENLELWWNRGEVYRYELAEAYSESELLGCLDSAETLVRDCRFIWERFGFWRDDTPAAAVRLHNKMYMIIGNRDKAAMLVVGVFAYAVRRRWNPGTFLSECHQVLAHLAAKGMAYQIQERDKKDLVNLFPSIVRDLRMRDEGLPTAERVLIWIARTGEHGSW